ncbi:hypothetical protein K402DRAFT_418464 [Aulographum hederae CBS 113979]|uniref:Uncharacterized protein n=1 Tax=Aulographum hederae CBS 113979 TaxID=1176131 RepID=A0A6G1H9L9_9PEZI|nr:hypothetical protein K402DRAFT_418464 [Aulographum hederae CBS 113979]
MVDAPGPAASNPPNFGFQGRAAHGNGNAMAPNMMDYWVRQVQTAGNLTSTVLANAFFLRSGNRDVAMGQAQAFGTNISNLEREFNMSRTQAQDLLWPVNAAPGENYERNPAVVMADCNTKIHQIRNAFNQAVALAMTTAANNNTTAPFPNIPQDEYTINNVSPILAALNLANWDAIRAAEQLAIHTVAHTFDIPPAQALQALNTNHVAAERNPFVTMVTTLTNMHNKVTMLSTDLGRPGPIITALLKEAQWNETTLRHLHRDLLKRVLAGLGVAAPADQENVLAQTDANHSAPAVEQTYRRLALEQLACTSLDLAARKRLLVACEWNIERVQDGIVEDFAKVTLWSKAVTKLFCQRHGWSLRRMEEEYRRRFVVGREEMGVEFFV